MFLFAFDKQVNHVKQNTNMSKLFNLLKSILKYPHGLYLDMTNMDAISSSKLLTF